MIARLRHSRSSFFSLFIAAFLIGAMFRIGPQVSASPIAGFAAGHSRNSANAAASPDYVVINNGDESPVPQNALARDVVSFYRAVINGEFARAYGLSVENHWQSRASHESAVVSTQPRSLFIAALNDEIGSEGLPVGIVRLAVDWERPLLLTRASVSTYPELLALRFLPRGTQVGSAYLAHVSGKLVGNCQIAGFSRTDAAVQINGQWKVLLPGRRMAGDPHFEEWFLPHTHFHATFRTGGG
jgi:hypothetical protein